MNEMDRLADLEVQVSMMQAERTLAVVDEFAETVLTSLLDNGIYSDPDEMAKRCYDIAEAMFKERNRRRL